MAIKTCMECGRQMPQKVRRQGSEPKFCGSTCRKTFNNRRMTRGAEMFDYVMSGRFERDTHGGLWRPVLSQMATRFRDQDKRDRNGRQSWHTPDPLGDPRSLRNK